MTSLCRRSLLKGAAATCGTGLLGACGGGADQAASPVVPVPTAPGAPPPAQAPAGAGLRLTLGQLADIPVGGAVSVSAPGGERVLLTQPSPGEVVAFSAVCPHEGCNAAPDGDHFACPCHGSQFELDGSLRKGPARRGLSPYAVQVVDGQVLPA